MSHNIKHYTYDEKVDRKSVQAELNHYVSMEDWQEGCSGLNNSIRWIESTICDSYDSAMDYLTRNDKGWYDCLAVRYRVPNGTTKALDALKQKANELSKKSYDLATKIHYKGIKSEFVGCKKCGSRLATKYISSNMCPLCRNELRPDSTLDAIAKVKNAYNEALKKVEEMEKEIAKKNGKVQWLVKIEYHT